MLLSISGTTLKPPSGSPSRARTPTSLPRVPAAQSAVSSGELSPPSSQRRRSKDDGFGGARFLHNDQAPKLEVRMGVVSNDSRNEQQQQPPPTSPQQHELDEANEQVTASRPTSTPHSATNTLDVPSDQWGLPPHSASGSRRPVPRIYRRDRPERVAASSLSYAEAVSRGIAVEEVSVRVQLRAPLTYMRCSRPF